MTNKEAKDVLLNYTCCCKYGTSPINCSDEECDFGKAIKTLCNRPKGEWVLIHPLQENDEGAYMCSVCHTGDWCISPRFKFCPYCGADMKGGVE